MADRQKIKAVLWDFGGVFTGSPFVGVRKYAESLGVDSKVLRELVFGSYDQDTDHPWHRLERGEQTMDATSKELAALAENSGIDGFTLDGFFQSMRLDESSKETDRSAVVGMVRKLGEAGIRNAIITNNIAEFRDAWRKMIPVDELFEEVVDSSAEGIRKPDPAIYHLALATVSTSLRFRPALVYTAFTVPPTKTHSGRSRWYGRRAPARSRNTRCCS